MSAFQSLGWNSEITRKPVRLPVRRYQGAVLKEPAAEK